MKKMLYIMGIDWNWIFQRPQILALELQKQYEVTVLCPRQFVQNKHQKKNIMPDRLVELYQLPFQEKSRVIGKIAERWHRRKMGDLNRYDLIWVGYPIFGRYIPEDFRGTVIYDCMDNFEALYPDRSPRAVAYVCEQEQKLLGRADVVLASSQKLKEKLLGIDPSKKIQVVRNGFWDLKIEPPVISGKKESYTLGYVGTISEWFDEKAILESLVQDDRIRYELVGPVSGKRIEHEKVTYCGVVEHHKLGETVAGFDCLLMPFVISEIVLYVDPVKLYEYIAWGKCIIASWYPEISRFSDFVYFYHDSGEYVELIKNLEEMGFPPKYTRQQQREFLLQNTWEERIRQITELLKEKKA